MRSLRSTLALAVFGALIAATQPLAGSLQQLRFGRLSLEAGLSQSTVYSVAQDARGFLWVGTEDGLNRYDGYEFTVYRHDPETPGSLAANTCYALLSDSSGVLWIGTWGGGLNRYDRQTGRFSAFRHDPADRRSLSHDTVFTLYEDSRGALWVGTLGGGLNRTVPGSGVFERFVHDPEDGRSLSHDHVTAIVEDSSGVVWVGTNGGGLNRFDPRTGDFFHFRHDPADPTSLASDKVFALYEDSAKQLWVGTHGGGLHRMDRDGGGFTRYRHDSADPRSLSSDHVLAIHEDATGTLWVGTGVLWVGASGGGLNRFHPETGSFSHFRHDSLDPASLASDDILTVYEDASGLFWLGTNGGGLSTFEPGRVRFAHFKRRPGDANSLSDNTVFGLHEDRQGFLWIGTWNGGLNRLDPRTGRFRLYRHDPDDPNSLPDNTVDAIHEDRERVLWAGTEKGLARLDRGSGRFWRWPVDPSGAPGPGNAEIQYLGEDREGQLWIGTYMKGLFRSDPRNGTSVHYAHDPGDPASLSSDNVYWVLEDSRGRIWVATEGGLNLLDPATGGFVHFRHDRDDPNSLSSDDVMNVFESRDGRIWAATYGGGLNLLEETTGRFRRFTTRDGLPNDSVYGALEDDEGALWLSTNGGLSRFDPRAETFTNFDVADGLQSNEFNSWALHRGPSGRMYFGGINGFNVFDPGEITQSRFVPPVALTSVKIFNREVDIGTPASELRELVVEHHQKVLSLQFAALDFAAPGKNLYAYKLDGFDDDWAYVRDNREVTYTNLNPGRYLFRVRGSNRDGVWNEEGLALPLVVVPPVWMTWWFRALAGLSVLLVGVAAYTLRTRAILARSRQLQEINLRLGDEIQERERAQGQLETKNLELEEKNEQLERFAYSISHDLKSPVVTILGFGELLEKDLASGNSERAHQDLEQIRVAGVRMRKQLDELLQLSRVGLASTPMEEVDLGGLAAEAIGQLAGLAAQRGVEIEVETGMPTMVAERARLMEVFQNLVENAIKFMGDQARPRIRIGGSRNRDEVVCYVRDNGRGIEPEYHRKIFDLFERLDWDSEGTGIGLALAKRVVEVNGGRIWVESNGRGEGSTFYFSLPLSEGAMVDAS